MKRDPTRICEITECDGGWLIELSRMGYPAREYVRTNWGDVVVLITEWAEGRLPGEKNGDNAK